MKSSNSLHSVGNSEEDALIVTVPSNEVNLVVSREKKSAFWLQLLDSVTGLPYNGTTATSVYLSSKATVDSFRKAVHLENSSILTGITSSQLLVYENKEAFDKRNAQEGKVLYLNNLKTGRAIETISLFA